MSAGRKFLVALTVPVVVGIVELGAQEPAISWEAAAGGRMAFEVASVKPGKVPKMPSFPLDSGDAKTPGGRFSETAPLLPYIVFAYKLSPSSPGLAQLPNWAQTELFDIEARAEGNPTKDQMRLMMQSLLADRFKLAVHFESREGPVFALTLVKPGQTGPKLRPYADGPACPDSFEMPSLPAPFTPVPPRDPSEVFPPVCGASQMRQIQNNTLVGSRNTTMELLAGDIYDYGFRAGAVDKPVVDRTGLEGRFDFTLDLPYAAFSFNFGPPNPDAPPAEPQGARFLNAVREQLGLKLVSSRGAIRKLVIDHVERPSEN